MILLLQRTILSKKNEVGMVQTHGNRVVVVSKKDIGSSIKNCDGLLTNDPETVLKISVADCMPLAIFDPATNSIGLIHAGWRGLDRKIIKNAIDLMIKNFSVKPQNLHVEIGPHICQRHYEIKNDVAERFLNYPDTVKKENGKMFLDLAEVAKEQLIKSGVNKNKIKFDIRCTFEDLSLPSFRRGDMKKRIHYLLKVSQSP